MPPDLADQSASELARLVRTREVSPVEVLDACLARLERYNPTLNAVVTLNEHARIELHRRGHTQRFVVWKVTAIR